LITPVVHLGHGEIIEEDEHLLVVRGSHDTSLELDQFAFDTALEVVGLRGTREIDSLEDLGVSVKLGSIHDDDGGLGGTGSSNEEGVLQAVLLTDGVALEGQLGDPVHDVLGTSRVGGRDQELGEDNLPGGFPLLGSPDAPLLGLGVNEVVEDGFLL
jgi:hypothetical protein